MLHDCCYKYSPFIFPLFIRAGMEVDEVPEFTTSPINGGSESINMDVGANGGVDPRIEFEVDRLLDY
jgi:hypothetical protein